MKRVSYLNDAQCREELLKLLTRIDEHLDDIYKSRKDKKDWWNRLGYSDGEIPDF
jgi:hypothetical protein